MHLDLAAFGPSADGHKYCLVAAVTAEIANESKLLTIRQCHLQQLKKLSSLRNLTATCTRSPDLDIVRMTSRTVRENSTIRSSRTCALTRTSHLSFSPAHQPSSNGIAERMVGMLKTTVRRLLKQAHLERQWWSYACKFAGHMMQERESVLGRPWTYLLFELVGIWKDQAKSLDDRGAVGYLLDTDIWQSGTTRIMQDGIVVKGLAPKPLGSTEVSCKPSV